MSVPTSWLVWRTADGSDFVPKERWDRLRRCVWAVGQVAEAPLPDDPDGLALRTALDKLYEAAELRRPSLGGRGLPDFDVWEKLR